MSAGPESAVGRVSGAESGRRLLRVLLSFSGSHPSWTVAELVEELGMNSSMVYRYVGLLREMGIVDAAGSGKYVLTDMVDGLTEAAAAVRTPLKEVVTPIIGAIRDEIGETVIVARRAGWRVFTVERAESFHPVRLQFEPGQAMSLHQGSLARMLLALMPAEERQRFLLQLPVSEREAPDLQPAALEQVLTQGYAESFGEIDNGIWGVASPLFAHGAPVGAIGCAAPLYRSDTEKRDQIRDAIQEGARRINCAL